MVYGIPDAGQGRNQVKTALVTNIFISGVILLLAACAMPPVQPVETVKLAFEPVLEPAPDRPVTSAGMVLDGKRIPLTYQVLLRTGQVIDGQQFAAVRDKQGHDIEVSSRPDFTSLLKRDDALLVLTQFEHLPGALYCTTLKQLDNGVLKAVATRAVDLQSIHGTWVPCAGSVTPWGSHLGSEEYEPDARLFFEAVDTGLRADHYLSRMARYFGGNSEASATQLASVLNPYRYGFAVEHTVQGRCDAVQSARHYAMGRLSVELALVMPDQRTVYLTDDGDYGGFYMFIADETGRLESGRLYAARWLQQQAGTEDDTLATLQWIELGHASDAAVARVIARSIRFEDMFERDMPTARGCTDDYRLVRTARGRECLRVKPDQELNASRLETRRYAALRGATTEFTKSEGMTFDPYGSTLYMAQSRITRGAVAAGQGSGEADHMRLSQNICGGVFAMRVGPDDALGSDYVAREVRLALQGRPVDDTRCDELAISSPDNLSFIPEAGLLLVGEDGSRHKRNKAWAWSVRDKSLTPVAIMPPQAEATSLYWYPNINGHAYMMLVAQHPYGQTPQAQLPSPDVKRAWVGVIGPMPVLGSPADAARQQ